MNQTTSQAPEMSPANLISEIRNFADDANFPAKNAPFDDAAVLLKTELLALLNRLQSRTPQDQASEPVAWLRTVRNAGEDTEASEAYTDYDEAQRDAEHLGGTLTDLYTRTPLPADMVMVPRADLARLLQISIRTVVLDRDEIILKRLESALDQPNTGQNSE